MNIRGWLPCHPWCPPSACHHWDLSRHGASLLSSPPSPNTPTPRNTAYLALALGSVPQTLLSDPNYRPPLPPPGSPTNFTPHFANLLQDPPPAVGTNPNSQATQLQRENFPAFRESTALLPGHHDRIKGQPHVIPSCLLGNPTTAPSLGYPTSSSHQACLILKINPLISSCSLFGVPPLSSTSQTSFFRHLSTLFPFLRLLLTPVPQAKQLPPGSKLHPNVNPMDSFWLPSTLTSWQHLALLTPLLHLETLYFPRWLWPLCVVATASQPQSSAPLPGIYFLQLSTSSPGPTCHTLSFPG